MYLLLLFLAGCGNLGNEVAQNSVAKVSYVSSKKIKDHQLSYKIVSIEGLHSSILKRHLKALCQEDQNGNSLNVRYSIKQSALMISEHNNSMFDNLVIKIMIDYRGQTKYAVMQHQHAKVEQWEHEEDLYYMIAQKIIHMMIIIDNQIEK